MPYMLRPNTEIPMSYGLRLVLPGELVLVADADVEALAAEGWQLGIDSLNASTTAPIAYATKEER